MKLLTTCLCFFALHTFGATIAVIDSGVDTKHQDLVNNLWKNLGEIPGNGRDEDGNGYQDDVRGWNFAESNNMVIDRKYLGTFSQDPYLFFEIQGKMFLNQASPAEIQWLRDKTKDPSFLQEMGKFGNFVHGTHVAGITVDGNADGKILSVKLIPTEIKPFVVGLQTLAKSLQAEAVKSDSDIVKDWRMKLLKGALTTLAGEQMKLLEEISNYVGEHSADIANGSFGTGFAQAKMITDGAFKVVYGKNPTTEESDDLARFFLKQLILAGEDMVAAAPKTLFVFAAGNDGTDNDIYPFSPTNIDADNVISVAATYKYEFIAPFSNYGTKTVDVAAPGMLIHSQIPGNEYLKVSGTSQAAPYVSNIAAQVKSLNSELTPGEIKRILMGTVDMKEYLAEKVKTGGIVNLERAVQAAKLSLTTTVDRAISEARILVSDVEVSVNKANSVMPFAVEPIPLPSLFR